jgi:hypothetical protein
VFRDLWNRIAQRRTARAVEEHGMSPAERRFAEQSPEDRQADLATREHLSGGDPHLPLDPD